LNLLYFNMAEFETLTSGGIWALGDNPNEFKKAERPGFEPGIAVLAAITV
jgi:hypothetical protein